MIVEYLGRLNTASLIGNDSFICLCSASFGRFENEHCIGYSVQPHDHMFLYKYRYVEKRGPELFEHIFVTKIPPNNTGKIVFGLDQIFLLYTRRYSKDNVMLLHNAQGISSLRKLMDGDVKYDNHTSSYLFTNYIYNTAIDYGNMDFVNFLRGYLPPVENMIHKYVPPISQVEQHLVFGEDIIHDLFTTNQADKLTAKLDEQLLPEDKNIGFSLYSKSKETEEYAFNMPSMIAHVNNTQLNFKYPYTNEHNPHFKLDQYHNELNRYFIMLLTETMMKLPFIQFSVKGVCKYSSKIQGTIQGIRFDTREFQILEYNDWEPFKDTFLFWDALHTALTELYIEDCEFIIIKEANESVYVNIKTANGTEHKYTIDFIVDAIMSPGLYTGYVSDFSLKNIIKEHGMHY